MVTRAAFIEPPPRHTEPDATVVPWTQRGKEKRAFPTNVKGNGHILGAHGDSPERRDRVLSRRDVDRRSDSIVELERRFMSLLCDCGMLCGRKVDGVGLVLRVWRIRGDPVEKSEPVARTKKTRLDIEQSPFTLRFNLSD